MTQSRRSYYSTVMIVLASFFLVSVFWHGFNDIYLRTLLCNYQYLYSFRCLVQMGADIMFLAGGAVLVYIALRREERLRREVAGLVIEAHSQERKRISRELHYVLAQDVLTLKMQLSNLRVSRLDVYGTSRTIRNEIEAIIDRLRLLAWEVTPPS